MDIENSTIFIPGATSGIGLGLARALHERGSHVIIGGRRTALLEQIASQTPGIDTVEIDMADASSIATASARVIDAHPDVDAIIAMAGIMRAEDWHSADGFADAEATVTTNLLGPIRLISAFVEHLQTRPAATIMTVSSGLAFAPLAVTPTYNAT